MSGFDSWWESLDKGAVVLVLAALVCSAGLVWSEGIRREKERQELRDQRSEFRRGCEALERSSARCLR